MKKILTVVGARPQFIKCAPVSRAIRTKYKEVLVHTGQHYDDVMSKQFFQELNIPEPDFDLKIGSGPHGEQTGRMMIELEKVVLREQPDGVIVYGDTNSTLAGALVASKLHIRLAHIEAGLRSFNKLMPEEQNRICTDHLSDILFCPTATALKNLADEGLKKNAYNTGDVMLDATIQYANKAASELGSSARAQYGDGTYYYFTLHRQENTDDVERFITIISIIGKARHRVVFPIHPRTRKVIDTQRIVLPENVIPIGPVGYLESLRLQKNAAIVITDSGGIQKEAYFQRVPCITMRDETEWIETVSDGFNVIAGMDAEKFRAAEERYLTQPLPSGNAHFGNGTASEQILSILSSQI